MTEKEKLHGALKLLAKTSFIVFIGIAISKLLGYLFRMIVARYFGPEVYGLFSLSLAIVGVIGAVGMLGLNDGLQRFIPIYRAKKKTNEIRYILSFVLKAQIVSGIFCGTLLYFLAEYISIIIFHNPALAIYIKILSIATPISFFSNSYLGVLRSYEEISWYSFIYNILQNLSRVIALIVLILLGLNASSVPLSFLISIIAMLIASYLVCRYKVASVFGKYKVKDKASIRKQVWSYSWPIIFYSIIASIFYWVDSFSLGYYKDASAVGIYNAAIPIIALLTIVPELFMNLFFPLINRHYANDNHHLIEQLSKQVNKWIFIVNVPLFILILTFPGAAINLLFGSQYLPAENALRILVIGSLFSSLTVVSNQLTSMMGKSRLILINIIISAIVNLGLNSLFIPIQKIGWMDNTNGLVGAALATLISISLFNALFYIETYHYMKVIPLRRKMVSILFIGILCAALLSYVRNIFVSNDIITLGILVSLFIAIYGLLIIVSRALDENDLAIVTALRNKVLGSR